MVKLHSGHFTLWQVHQLLTQEINSLTYLVETRPDHPEFDSIMNSLNYFLQIQGLMACRDTDMSFEAFGQGKVLHHELQQLGMVKSEGKENPFKVRKFVPKTERKRELVFDVIPSTQNFSPVEDYVEAIEANEAATQIEEALEVAKEHGTTKRQKKVA